MFQKTWDRGNLLDKMARYACEHDISIMDALKEIDFIGVSPKVAKAAYEFYELIKGLYWDAGYLSVTN